jgi:hypothetical protein
MKRLLLTALLGLTLAAPAAAGSRETSIRAQLAPVAPAAAGSGIFTARATTTQGLVTLRWQLSLARLSGQATRATLTLAGPRIALVLCKPCSARAHGAMQLLGRNPLARGGKVVVATRAHPKGELRGTVRSG